MHSPDLRPRLQALRASRIFAALPEAALQQLAANMAERQVAAGEAIFAQCDTGLALFVVLAGQVRIVVGGADGREHVLRVFGPGDVFGEIAVLDGQPRTADAMAVTKCRLMVLERRHLLTLLTQSPELAISLIAALCERLRSTNAQLEGLLFHSLSKRLASVLLALCDTRGGTTIDITQTELGQLTGVTRESINKKLRAWQAAGLVALQPGRIVVLQRETLARGMV